MLIEPMYLKVFFASSIYFTSTAPELLEPGLRCRTSQPPELH